MRKKSAKNFKDTTATFKPEHVTQWTVEVEKWEKNPSAPNPFTETTNSTSASIVVGRELQINI